MSPLAEQIAVQIREEVAGKVERRNRLYHVDDSFDTSEYVRPRIFRNRNTKSVDSKNNPVKNQPATKNKNNQQMKIKLNVGDEIILDAWPQMVIWTDETKARVSKPDGETRLLKINQPDCLLRTKATEGSLKMFLLDNALSLESLNNKKAGEEKDETVMKKKNIEQKLKEGAKNPPRGGLAAEVAKRKAAEKAAEKAAGTAKTDKKATPKPTGVAETAKEALATSKGRTKGRLGALFTNEDGSGGHSVVRCVAAAGEAGAEFDKVMAALKVLGVVPKESTVKQNLRLGKTGKIEGANLTKEQLAAMGV